MEPTEDLFDFDPNEPLSIDQAMRLGTALHRAGHREVAFNIYQRVLEQEPDQADALHFLGMLAHEQRSFEAAVRLMGRSVTLVPDHPGFRSNFGNLLLDNGMFEEAEREYRQALDLDPDRPDALNNYAVLCKALGRYQEAEASLLRALEIDEDFTGARNNLASLYLRMGRVDESVQQACEALAREPRNAPSRELLGYAYSRSGRFEEAAQVYRDWLADVPDDPKARHYLAACTGQGVPARASDAYVQSVFDAFANSFDAKLAMLEYRAPNLVAAAVTGLPGMAEGGLVALDAGCGTGLCGPLLRPLAGRLAGIDLSQGMLAKARDRGLYDELHQAELTAFMQTHPAGHDLVVSADTLVYFGALREVMGAAALTLRPGGLLCFTVEALGEEETADYRLRHHGRYAHGRAYVEAEVLGAGLDLLVLDSVVLRLEGGVPVAGWLVLARRPGPRQAPGGGC